MQLLELLNIQQHSFFNALKLILISKQIEWGN